MSNLFGGLAILNFTLAILNHKSWLSFLKHETKSIVYTNSGNTKLSSENLRVRFGRSRFGISVTELSTGNLRVSLGNVQSRTGNAKLGTGSLRVSLGNTKYRIGDANVKHSESESKAGERLARLAPEDFWPGQKG